MIVSFRHKGLERYFRTGSTSGIQVAHARKLSRILAALDAADRAADLDLPGYRLHRLKGKLSKRWSVSVSGNWRVTFTLDGQDAELVDYEDYH